MRKRRYIVNGERISHDDYVKTKYEDLRIRVIKGKKADLQAHAESKGESLNAFVNRAIDEAVERDKGLIQKELLTVREYRINADGHMIDEERQI